MLTRHELRTRELSPESEERPALQASPSPTTSARPQVIAWLVALVVALASGLLLGRQPVSALERQIADQARQGQVQQSTIADQGRQIQTLKHQLDQMRSTCDDAAALQPQLASFLGQGQVDWAVGLAETKLAQADPPLCSQAQVALATFWYSASLDQLFALPTPGWPGSEAELQLLARWQDIERRASQVYHVPNAQRWSPMSVAVKAMDHQEYALADVAFRQAWREGELLGQAVLFRYQLLLAWGQALVARGGPAERDQAIHILATARAIAAHYDLPKAEACQTLVDLGYKNCQEVEPDPNEPVLAGKQ